MQGSTGQEQRQSAPRQAPTDATLRPATLDDVPTLARVLARAFDRDPLANWLVRQDARRVTRLESSFDLMLRDMSSNLNETYTTDDQAGTALWKRPGEFKLPVHRQIRLLPGFARVGGWTRVPALLHLMHHMEQEHDRLVPEPHFYLFVLGVDPSQQRRGLGRKLLAPVLTRCREEGTRAYLETATAENVPFYQRQGFEVARIIERAPWPKLWLMTF